MQTTNQKEKEQSYDTIEQEIYYYIDEDTGEKIYDAELMLEEFQDKLNELTKGTIWKSKLPTLDTSTHYLQNI